MSNHLHATAAFTVLAHRRTPGKTSDNKFPYILPSLYISSSLVVELQDIAINGIISSPRKVSRHLKLYPLSRKSPHSETSRLKCRSLTEGSIFHVSKKDKSQILLVIVQSSIMEAVFRTRRMFEKYALF